MIPWVTFPHYTFPLLVFCVVYGILTRLLKYLMATLALLCQSWVSAAIFCCTLERFQRISVRKHSFQDNVVSHVLLNGFYMVCCIRWHFGRPFWLAFCLQLSQSFREIEILRQIVNFFNIDVIVRKWEREDFRPRTNLEFWEWELIVTRHETKLKSKTLWRRNRSKWVGLFVVPFGLRLRLESIL